MKISLIACINQINALGKNNDLLYHISSDLANFKRLTMGKILIMGKNTYESLPKKPLPNRTTIIICNEEDYVPHNTSTSDFVFVADSIDAALSTASTLNAEEVCVVGGASLYRQFIESELVDTMYLTVVNDETKGDVSFPEIDSSKWILRYLSDPMEASPNDKLTYNFTIYERIR